MNVTFISSMPDPFPLPIHKSGERTAIIISGELRSGNISFASNKIIVKYQSPDPLVSHPLNTPPTPIKAFLEWVVQPIAKHGGVDLFIYMPVYQTTNISKSVNWDGDPFTYTPYPGDTRACHLYSDNPIFAAHTGNKVFCLAEYDHILLDRFIKHHRVWSLYYDKIHRYREYNAWEIFLQQEYGKYRGNQAAKQYSVLSNIKYKYKIRTRHDETAAKEFPPLSSLKFHGINEVMCGRKTRPFCFHPTEKSNGGEGVDSFHIALSEDADHYLDRYIDLHTIEYPMQTGGWNSEVHLGWTVGETYGPCLIPHENISMHKIRRRDYEERLYTARVAKIDWVVMPPAPD